MDIYSKIHKTVKTYSQNGYTNQRVMLIRFFGRSKHNPQKGDDKGLHVSLREITFLLFKRPRFQDNHV